MKWAALALTLAGTQAAALSCMQADPLEAFDRAQASDAPYLVLSGRITLDTPAPSRISKPASLPGRFDGVGLSHDGFTVPFNQPINLDILCSGPWCGVVPVTEDVLVFANADGDQPTIASPACPAWIFQAPDLAMQDRLTQCLLDGFCDADR